MKFKRLIATFLLTVFLHPQVQSKNISEQVRKAVKEIKDRLPLIRVLPEDCSNPTRWNLSHAIPQVENLLSNPLDAPLHLSRWSSSVLENHSAPDLIRFSRSILISSETATRRQPARFKKMISKTTSPSLPDPISRIVQSIQKAQPLLKESFSALSESERQAILALYDLPVDQKFENPVRSAQFKRKTYRGMEKFKLTPLLAAAEMVSQSVKNEMEQIRNLSRNNLFPRQIRAETPAGIVLVRGPDNDYYDADSLENVTLLIDLGGNNRYQGSVAGAREGEIKVVIDFGEKVEILSGQTSVTAGAGIFGVGLLYLENPKGKKSILTDSYAQGFGLCGVGGIFVNGTGTFKGNRYVQGAGSFGVGMFSNRSGVSSQYETNLYGQGVGFTKGIGIFHHKGSDSVFLAGLVNPDPRESLGSTSLCQGVGYGPRAYAAGGVGICALKGDRLRLESSYFAQGAGYWHAAGVFYLQGSSNSVQARRYDQGSGIHSAAGSFILKGDHNHVINWGVGPAFGWDKGLGWALTFGDGNQFQADWGAGTASINASRSFSYFSGNGNKFALPGLGSSQYSRDRADYALSIIRGQNNVLQAPLLKTSVQADQAFFYSPWSLIEFEGTLTPDIGLPKPQWRRLPRNEYVEKEKVNLQDEVEKAALLPGVKKVERLIQVASTFSIDKSAPRHALARLVSLEDHEIPYVIRSLDPADFEGFIQIRAVTGILGERASKTILEEIDNEKGERRAWLLSLLAFVKTESAVPKLLKTIHDPDWKIQAVSVRILGELFNRYGGKQPGRSHTLKKLEKWLKAKRPSSKLGNHLVDHLINRTFAETAALLSLTWQRTIPERLKFLESAPEDISGNLDAKQSKILLESLRLKREEALRNIQNENRTIESLKEKVREALILKIEEGKNTRKSMIYSVVVALGKMGNERDALRISRFLRHDSALVREASSSSLERLGKSSVPFLKSAMKDPNPQTRIQALSSIYNTSNPSFLFLLKSGLKDEDTQVRKTAISLIQYIQNPLTAAKKKHIKRIKKVQNRIPRSELAVQTLFLYGP